jgi:cobalt-zinc-cadmium resistance protein CzcA
VWRAAPGAGAKQRKKQAVLKGLLAFGLTRRPIILLALLVFCGAGVFAFTKLNIEAYPNPAPVILEITAQAAGLSAEEMERYYTIPMEIGLYPTPGIDNIRSTSFYGLTFVRVTFKYGVDFYFAFTQAALSLQQNVTLPANQIPQIQQSSLVGEIFRYQVVGPPHFGLTNLRTVQDWVVLRRLFTVPGVVQVNSWGGTTKQYNVDVDLNKLDAYSITIPQIITALGNANVNVGGREITVGQQSVNIRGVGLVDSGGADDLTKGYRTEDVENIVLTQVNGVPVTIKDVAKVEVGFVPRLGIAGRDHEDDVALSIVVMNRTLHTNDVLPRIKAEVERMNNDGTLPPGVKLVPYYDRAALVSVTTHTVLHNLIFGCVLVFLIQWIFLGDLRSAIIVGVNIPFALFFAVIILVVMGEDANLLSVGAVDFGIIVDSAVILVENIFRNFQAPLDQRQTALHELAEEHWGEDPTKERPGTVNVWTDRLRLIFVSALQVDKAILFSATITVAAFVPLFTMQGVEGQIFSPMARTYGYALAGALIATFTITPVLASFLLPEHVHEAETIVVRALRTAYVPVLHWSLIHRKTMLAIGLGFLVAIGFIGTRLGSEFLPHLEEGNLWIRVQMPPTMGLDAGTPATGKLREIMLRHPEILTTVTQHGRPDNGSDASPFSNVEIFAPLKPFDEWPAGYTKEKLIEELNREFTDEIPGGDVQLLAIHPGQYRGGDLGRQRIQFSQDSRPQSQRSGGYRQPGAARDGEGPGRHRSRNFPRRRPAEPEHQGRPREDRPLRPQYRRRQHCDSGGLGRHRGHHAARGRPPIQHPGSPCPELPHQPGNRRRHQGRLYQRGRHQLLYSVARAHDDHARYRGVVHLS